MKTLHFYASTVLPMRESPVSLEDASILCTSGPTPMMLAVIAETCASGSPPFLISINKELVWWIQMHWTNAKLACPLWKFYVTDEDLGIEPLTSLTIQFEKTKAILHYRRCRHFPQDLEPVPVQTFPIITEPITVGPFEQ